MIGRRSKQYEMDMCSGSLAGKILLFSLPLMLSSLLQLLFNAADVIVVGRYAAMPTQAVAAVGSNGALINLTINLFMGISVGANVVVAQDLGAGRGERVGHSIETAITLALVSGFALSVFGVICVRQLLEWMSCPADVIDLSTQYMRIYFVGMPGNLVYNFGAALLRAKGDTQRPLSYLTAAGVINVILNLILVIGLHLDVAGVAIATVVSQYVSAALVVWCLTKESGPFHLDLRQLKMEKAALMRMMRIGVPAGFQGILFSISNVIIQSALNSFGNSALIAGASASASIEMFVYSGDNAISQAALTFVSQNYGAGKCRRVDRAVVLCTVYMVVFQLVFGNLAYFFGAPLAGLYVPGQEEAISFAVARMAFLLRLQFLNGTMDIGASVLRGLGCSFSPMVVTLIGVCVFRVFWVYTVFPVVHTPESLYISYPISWTVTTVVLLVIFLVLRKKLYARMQRLTSVRTAESDLSDGGNG